MPVDNLEQKLAENQEAWEAAKAFSAGELPDDGTYQGLIHRFDFFESKKGEVFLKTMVQIMLDPDWEGQVVEILHNLSDPDRLQWAKQHLHNCGLDVEDFSTLESQLHTLLDVPVELAVKTSTKTDASGNPYRNAYVNQRLGDPPGTDPATDIPTDSPSQEPAGVGNNGNPDDDIPF